MVAVTLGMPLLLTGEPGTGKTHLAYRIAAEFTPDRDEPLVFETKSSSIAQDLFYAFDTVGRFAFAQVGKYENDSQRAAALDPRRFIRYQALGDAILRSRPFGDVAHWLPPNSKDRKPTRSVVLIDEIDKAPRDFPNDLLNEIAKFEFRVPEISDDRIKAAAELRPLVVITSNSEKQLPDAFLRRCVYHHIAMPKGERLRKIVAQRTPKFAGVPMLSENAILVRDAVAFFEDLREKCPQLDKKPSTAELLNWVEVMLASGAVSSESLKGTASTPIAERTLSTMLKSQGDFETGRKHFESFIPPM